MSPLPHAATSDCYKDNDKRSDEPVLHVLGTCTHEYVFMLFAFMLVFLLFIYVAVLAYINKDVLQDVGTNDEDTRDGDHIPLYDNCSQLAFSLTALCVGISSMARASRPVQWTSFRRTRGAARSKPTTG